MNALILILIGLIEAAAVGAFVFLLLKKTAGATSSGSEVLEIALTERQTLHHELETLLEGAGKLPMLKQAVREYVSLRESLKAERGRVTITQAELETVENRNRELEEIERELEASGLETKEELKILKKKEKDLGTKNDALKQQLSDSTEQLNRLLTELEMNSQLQEQVTVMSTEMVMTEEKVVTLLLNIEQCNDQYIVLKRRYDALDIEYAQLYEKFSESQAAEE